MYVSSMNERLVCCDDTGVFSALMLGLILLFVPSHTSVAPKNTYCTPLGDSETAQDSEGGRGESGQLSVQYYCP